MRAAARNLLQRPAISAGRKVRMSALRLSLAGRDDPGHHQDRRGGCGALIASRTRSPGRPDVCGPLTGPGESAREEDMMSALLASFPGLAAGAFSARPAVILPLDLPRPAVAADG